MTVEKRKVGVRHGGRGGSAVRAGLLLLLTALGGTGCGKTVSGEQMAGNEPADSPAVEQTGPTEPIAGEDLPKVSFGHYEQDLDAENGPEEISWIVLREEEDRLLLLSAQALECMPYDEGKEGIWQEVTWEDCSLRKWLNGAFLETAFSAEEQRRILEVTLENPGSETFFASEEAAESYAQWWGMSREKAKKRLQKWGTSRGEDTTDRVFCLSYEEVWEFLPGQQERMATATFQALGNGTWIKEFADFYRAPYWLRSSGATGSSALFVRYDTEIEDIYTYYAHCGVRPALWVLK